jgi:prophage antirepressor-like protein
MVKTESMSWNSRWTETPLRNNRHRDSVDGAVSLFNFNTHQVRVVTIDGNPWFVATDICNILGLGWDKANQTYAPTKACRALSSDQIGRFQMPTKRGVRDSLIVSESGFYKLVMRSDRPEASPFQDWVTRDVLPAIRKDGMYIIGEEAKLSPLKSESLPPTRRLAVSPVPPSRD